MSEAHDQAQGSDAEGAAAATAERSRRRALVGSAFTPASPVTNQDLFAGRVEQLARLIDVASLPGKHAVIYGERGVGKTSLARVASAILGGPYLSLYYTCSSLENFSAIWHGVLGEAQLSSYQRRVGFSAEEFAQTVVPAAALLQESNGGLSPNQLRQALQVLASIKPVVVFIDEFDRLEDRRTRNQFAHTIKLLADQGVNATLGPPRRGGHRR